MHELECRKPGPCQHGGSRQPDLDRLVDAPGRDDVHELLHLLMRIARAVRLGRVTALRGCLAAPGQASDEMPVGLHGLDTPSRGELPDAYCVIVRRRKEKLPSRVENEGAYPVVMTGLWIDYHTLSALAPARKADKTHEIPEHLATLSVPQLNSLVPRACGKIRARSL